MAGALVSAGTLYLVSTPIGNLGDLSPRAIEVLQSVETILAEDTRHSRPMLDRFAVQTPLLAHHEHNEAKSTPALVARLAGGARLALISDAGTPLLSDPGARLVRAAIDAGVSIVPVPGASALLAALVGSGLDATSFTFYGFLARKGKERSAVVREVVESRHTSVLYEAPGRVGDTLADLGEAGAGDRQAVVARELTKQFEEFRRGTVSELALSYEETAPRGEVVLLVSGAVAVALDEEALRVRAGTLRGQGLSARDVVRVLMEETAAPRNLAYRLAHE
ncbi:MAG: 16S rRNA (cytidine(1402)-2'-O)-methyltransferase [Gemmatimonadetes bacterium]|nr:16S rRNA (cytidine(1402)-2'-O)-methyltransferase [Gemmatimonadota bacterium]